MKIFAMFQSVWWIFLPRQTSVRCYFAERQQLSMKIFWYLLNYHDNFAIFPKNFKIFLNIFEIFIEMSFFNALENNTAFLQHFFVSRDIPLPHCGRHWIQFENLNAHSPSQYFNYRNWCWWNTEDLHCL